MGATLIMRVQVCGNKLYIQAIQEQDWVDVAEYILHLQGKISNDKYMQDIYLLQDGDINNDNNGKSRRFNINSEG